MLLSFLLAFLGDTTWQHTARSLTLTVCPLLLRDSMSLGAGCVVDGWRAGHRMPTCSLRLDSCSFL